MSFKDWKFQTTDPLSHWLSKLNQNQLNLIEEVKNDFNSSLSEFSEMKTEELTLLIEQHISFDAQKQLLDKRHGNIINNDDYIPHYRNVLDRNTNLINNDNFNEFVMSFGIVGISSSWIFELEKVKAGEYLENIATLNIIERFKMTIKDVEIFGNPRFKNIPEWQKTLAKLANRFDTKLKPTSKFTVIFYWMKSKQLLNDVDGTVFRKFVFQNYQNQLMGLKFNNFSKIDIDDSDNDYIKAELASINKSK